MYVIYTYIYTHTYHTEPLVAARWDHTYIYVCYMYVCYMHIYIHIHIPHRAPSSGTLRPGEHASRRQLRSCHKFQKQKSFEFFHQHASRRQSRSWHKFQKQTSNLQNKSAFVTGENTRVRWRNWICSEMLGRWRCQKHTPTLKKQMITQRAPRPNLYVPFFCTIIAHFL